jgi:hypothetical protein
LFLEALKKDLARSSSLVVGVVSIGASNSSGVATDRKERPELFLYGSSSPVSLALFFLTREGSQGGGFHRLGETRGKKSVFGVVGLFGRDLFFGGSFGLVSYSNL